MAKTIAITYEKGGVGKTTTAVNVSAILAARGCRVLLTDLDPQAYATGYFGLYDDDRPGIYEVLSKGLPAEGAVVPTDFHFDLLPATHSLAAIETDLAAIAFGQEYILKTALRPLAGRYDFILMDCPPAGLRIKTNALAAADALILPTIPDDFAIRGLVCISKQLLAMKRGTNPGLKVLGVLLTLDEHTSNKTAYKQALQAQNIFPCFRQTIRKNTALSAAINSHQPVTVYDRHSNGAKDYTAFADELLTAIKEDV